MMEKAVLAEAVVAADTVAAHSSRVAQAVLVEVVVVDTDKEGHQRNSLAVVDKEGEHKPALLAAVDTSAAPHIRWREVATVVVDDAHIRTCPIRAVAGNSVEPAEGATAEAVEAVRLKDRIFCAMEYPGC